MPTYFNLAQPLSPYMKTHSIVPHCSELQVGVYLEIHQLYNNKVPPKSNSRHVCIQIHKVARFMYTLTSMMSLLLLYHETLANGYAQFKPPSMLSHCTPIHHGFDIKITRQLIQTTCLHTSRLSPLSFLQC